MAKKKSTKRAGKRSPRLKVKSFSLAGIGIVELKARKFRTNPKSRSKKRREFIIGLPLSTYRELSVSLVKAKKPAAKTSFIRRYAGAAALIVIGAGGVFYFATLTGAPAEIAPPTSAVLAQESTSSPRTAKFLTKSEPVRLAIDKVGINTSLAPVGKNADGSMEVPKAYDSAGWYQYAPTPGQKGPAVIVGHVDRPGGVAVFWRLRELAPGDKLTIDRADGQKVVFKVTQVKQLSQDSFPTDEVYGNIDHAGIRIITCSGKFDRAAHKYSHNTVVYGQMESYSKP